MLIDVHKHRVSNDYINEVVVSQNYTSLQMVKGSANKFTCTIAFL